jgi:hypothetical protein
VVFQYPCGALVWSRKQSGELHLIVGCLVKKPGVPTQINLFVIDSAGQNGVTENKFCNPS